MIKLVFTDIDDTLLDTSKKISEDNRRAIKEMHDRGVKFGIASGRTSYNLQRVYPTWNLGDTCDYLLGSNGAEIYDFESNETRLIYKFSKKEVIDIYNYINQEFDDVSICVYEDDYLCTNLVTDIYLERIAQTGLKEKVINFETDLKDYYPKVIVVAVREKADEILNYALNNKTDYFRTFKSQAHILEFTLIESSKSKGIEEVMNELNLQRDEIMTLGDNDNDYEMIRDFFGVAMDNASSLCKSEANAITSSCNDSGVARAIEKFVLKQ